ncbi:FAD-dependent oxidoreductase [Pediococcus acidilactici]
MEKFDVVIIGAGPAGLGLAYDLKQAGQAVAVVEENRWGGTCPNRGCDPKKVLMAAVEAKLRSHHLVGKGLENEPEIDWPSLMRFKETFTEPVSSSSRQGLVDAGITVLDGHAEFVDQHTLKVGEQRVESSQFVIATGQRPGRLSKIENEALMQTSTDFLAMPELPKRIALVGGGYIAFELAAIANAAGAEVHVIHHNDRPLKQFPAKSVKQFMEQLTKQGVQFHLNIDVTAIEKNMDGDDYFDILPTIMYYMDEPLSNPSAMQLFYLSKGTRENVKVALSGEGADEFFGGYNTYLEAFTFERYQKLVPQFIRTGLAKMVSGLPRFHGRRFLMRGAQPLSERYYRVNYVFNQQERSEILAKPELNVDSGAYTQHIFDEVRGKLNIIPIQSLKFSL